jgi:16S rRNA (cytosine967-C5)-methyltransferase
VLHRARPKDIAALAQEQTALLRRAADWLLPGGTLVFATCSLEPEEGEDQVEPAIAAGLALDPVKAGELPEGLDSQPGGWVRVLPRDGMDGFFAVRFRKPDASLVAR